MLQLATRASFASEQEQIAHCFQHLGTFPGRYTFDRHSNDDDLGNANGKTGQHGSQAKPRRPRREHTFTSEPPISAADALGA
jgi:hypothetical protein